MTAEPLFPQRIVPEPPSWFQRKIHGASDGRAATEAIKQLLSTKNSTADAAAIEAIFANYGVTSAHAKFRIREAVYHAAVTRLSASDDPSLERGTSSLMQVASSLGLSQASVDRTHAESVRESLAKEVRGCLEDRRFSMEERVRIHERARSLAISDGERDDIIRAELRPIIVGAVDSIVADRRYSPAEERALRALAEDLGIDLALGDQTVADLERMRAMWLAENGQLPEVSVTVNLMRGEVCHYSASCAWHEMRTRTVRTDYVGISGSVRIMKGVRVRIGSVAPRSVKTTELAEVAAGVLYVTNRRVLLDGQHGNKSLPWRSVFGQEIFSDAIRLEKTSGKDPYLFISPNEIEYASVIVAAAMAAGS